MFKVEQHVLLQEFGTNTWLLWCDETLDGVLIDTSAPSTKLLQHIAKLKLNITHIITTHGHGDHIGGNSFFKSKLNCQIAIHQLDAPMLVDNKKNFSEYMGMAMKNEAADIILEDGDIIPLSKGQIKVIHTPGHTRGGICLMIDKFLFSGDTLFEQSIGRTDLPGGSFESIVHSIKTKLYTLADDVVVFPGHGPKTSIGIEKKINPFI
jgi:glyoxylase-like metal-dependent hydrolase (beta-lactamase superfamily II)